MATSNHVYDYQTKSGHTRYIIASYNDDNGQYTALMTDEAERLTGCWAEYARSIEALVNTHNIQTYSTAWAARRAMARLRLIEA